MITHTTKTIKLKDFQIEALKKIQNRYRELMEESKEDQFSFNHSIVSEDDGILGIEVDDYLFEHKFDNEISIIHNVYNSKVNIEEIEFDINEVIVKALCSIM